MSQNQDESKVAEYKVNPLLIESNDDLTGIRIRALHPDGGWGEYDVACLMADDFDLYIGAVEGRAQDVAKRFLTKLIEANGKNKAAQATLEDMTRQIARLTDAIDELTED